MNPRYTKVTFLLEIIGIVLGVIFLIPFYFVIINSVKGFADILIDAAAWPQEFLFSNYLKVWDIINFPRAFWNSLIITVISNIGLVVISSMAAWKMVRTPGKFSKILFALFVSAMVIPFQTVMIPLMKLGGTLNLTNSIPGLIIMYFGFGVPLSLFLYHGFIKTVPIEIEESARIDGCSQFGVFWRIVFPLLKPITVTVVILNTLWIWNDYLLPLLVLQDAELRTIPLATSSFFAQYTKQWDMGLAALVMGITPVVIFFLFLQRHIIKGIAQGSIK
ncbi:MULTISPECIES: carbohydrate ABC transporter permease [Cytobacillus]|jgi:raffinose/stachyose/melibiose transport system permease protein|uniref:Sugar ABC transporter permease n=3 Tax=Cytobacillus TaxID=2675230 RepID=A0A160M9D9_9BACI|nr:MULTISPECIES: carbohydrate ABC transporter permease [Cytobacillus]MDM5226830.1 carbohydrate ABC transporter permease [Cytobacillus sp. NJ13]AND38738.1 sugar ABC transporter permease [Cytobacillus oceanisediminis 2691]MBU8767912.1 carbohydrate ABC transporter permease [Cytobacillus oceanisediminis]MBY0159994.1 carbohydrate ABC transporter permease [Cytobacillus firmus]MCM3241131.1 carbohydrate ABC transporter permease [Cytobacillus oceanisediminis]